jgi:hypothetical protein
MRPSSRAVASPSRSSKYSRVLSRRAFAFAEPPVEKFAGAVETSVGIAERPVEIFARYDSLTNGLRNCAGNILCLPPRKARCFEPLGKL